MSNREAPLVIATVVALVASCGDPKVAHDPPPTPRDARVEPRPSVHLTNTEMPGVIKLDGPKVELPKQESFRLLDPGKGARLKLRYVLAAGEASYRVETTLTSRHLTNGTWSGKVALPAIRDGFGITVSDAKSPALALRPLPVELAGATTPDAEQYTASWKRNLEGRRVTASVDDRGQLGSFSFNDDPTSTRTDGAKDELAQRLLATLIPLPEEPIGVGAKWQVTTILRQGHAYVKQTGNYTLLAQDATTWTLGVKLLRIGEEQTIADPALPKGTVVDLVAMFRVLEGTVKLTPKAPLGAGTLTVESRLHARLTSGTGTVEQLLEDTGTVRLFVEPPAKP